MKKKVCCDWCGKDFSVNVADQVEPIGEGEGFCTFPPPPEPADKEFYCERCQGYMEGYDDGYRDGQEDAE